MKLTYGRDADMKTDRYIHIGEEAVAMIENSLFPGALLVNIFPSREFTKCILIFVFLVIIHYHQRRPYLFY